MSCVICHKKRGGRKVARRIAYRQSFERLGMSLIITVSLKVLRERLSLCCKIRQRDNTHATHPAGICRRLQQGIKPQWKFNCLANLAHLFYGESLVINVPSLDFWTVWILSVFTTQSSCTPSSSDVNKTSDGIPRITVVIGATVIPVKNEMAEFRVRISTGRR